MIVIEWRLSLVARETWGVARFRVRLIGRDPLRTAERPETADGRRRGSGPAGNGDVWSDGASFVAANDLGAPHGTDGTDR